MKYDNFIAHWANIIKESQVNEDNLFSPKYEETLNFDEVFEKISKFLESKKYINTPNKEDQCVIYGNNPHISISFIDENLDFLKCEVPPEDIVKDVTDFIKKENLPVDYEVYREGDDGSFPDYDENTEENEIESLSIAVRQNQNN